MADMKPQRPLTMCLSELSLLKLVSTGKGSKVFLAKDHDRHLALKVISKKQRSYTSINSILAEQNVLLQLTQQNDPFFPSIIASWHDSANFYLATRYFPGGDMAVELMRCRFFDEDRARIYMAQLIVALERLHSRRIIHRDVKPSNILFDSTGHLILADFGVSRSFDSHCLKRTETVDSGCFIQRPPNPSEYTATQQCGTPLFMSPEQLRGDAYSFEVDYWAAGVTLYRMLTGVMPFGNNARHKPDISKSILEDELSFDQSPEISISAKHLLRSMLAKNPSERIPYTEIKSHPFFLGIDWHAVETRSIPSPWMPYLPPIPVNSRTTITVEYGAPYPPWADPYPKFTWFSNSPVDSWARQELQDKKKNDKKPRSYCGLQFLLRLFWRSDSEREASPEAPLPSKMVHELQLSSQEQASFSTIFPSPDQTLCGSPSPLSSKHHYKVGSMV
ncbi:kinase-like protein [Dendrothele bispora CBS 962.96]|uniref:non-specific serine/threonine protein kinase n=1 Tax=Dendrothele bispora (strain CBS 962.96) TaxID=1314807 RepID=A0A4S8MR46_DENBC|nr:kinase-like protein [Dendrothele bispora CBS 962.96]